MPLVLPVLDCLEAGPGLWLPVVCPPWLPLPLPLPLPPADEADTVCLVVLLESSELLCEETLCDFIPDLEALECAVDTNGFLSFSDLLCSASSFIPTLMELTAVSVLPVFGLFSLAFFVALLGTPLASTLPLFSTELAPWISFRLELA